MKVTINIKYFAIAISSWVTAILLAQGVIQKIIHFAGPENEIGCFVLACTMGTISAICIFEKTK